MTALEARDVVVRYRGAARPAIDGVSLTLEPGRLVGVAGPNGSGKSTLLGALTGLLEPASGSVLLDGRPIREWAPRDRATRIGVVSQREEYPFAWRVGEVVAFGRYARLEPLAGLGNEDRAVIARSMQRADVLGLADRRIDTLSGGEWQRVRIARALAQEAAILVLDEPTAALDLGHEMEVFELIRELTDEGMASVLVTHHLNLTARFADRLLVMHEGRAVGEGAPAAVLGTELLERVFGWPVRLDQVDGVPQVVPLRRGRTG